MVARLFEANGSMCFLVQRMVVDENIESILVQRMVVDENIESILVQRM